MLSKIKKVLNNPKVNFATGLMIGLIIMATGVYAATLVNSKNVTYNTTNSTLSSTNVQDALDELYDKINNKLITYAFGKPTINSPVDFQEVISSSGSNVLVKKQGNQLSVCQYYKNQLFCLKNGEKNWEENKAMLNTTTFPEATCSVESNRVICTGDSLECGAYSIGDVYCLDDNSGKYCYVYADGKVECQDE